MISHLPMPEGVELPRDASAMRADLGKLIIAHSLDLEILKPGVYDITPRIWTRNNHQHEVIVLDNGTGLYRMIPKTEDVGTVERTPEGTFPYTPGGHANIINEENPVVIVAGGHPTKSETQVFDMVLYTPDRGTRSSEYFEPDLLIE
jgi:hypothetical protein